MHVASQLEGIKKSSQCFCLLDYFYINVISLSFYFLVHVFYADIFYLFVLVLYADRTIKLVHCVSRCDTGPISFTGASCYTADEYDRLVSLGELCDSIFTSLILLYLCLCVDCEIVAMIFQ